MSSPTVMPPGASSGAPPHDAVRLAAALRGTRTSLLTGPPGCGKSTLLLQGLRPLLGRRAVDRGVAPGRFPAAPSRERRRRAEAPWAAPAEAVVYVDAWAKEPLVGLIGRVQGALGRHRVVDRLDESALADSLVVWGRQLGARVLLILDHFEQVLQRDARGDEIVRLHRALRHAVLLPQLPANFLFALREEAAGHWAAWRRELPGFDRQHLRLPARAPAADNGAIGTRG